MCTPSYNCVTILTSEQQKFESFRKGGGTFLYFGGGINKKGEGGATKFPEVEGEQKGGAIKIFWKNWRRDPPRRTLWASFALALF